MLWHFADFSDQQRATHPFVHLSCFLENHQFSLVFFCPFENVLGFSPFLRSLFRGKTPTPAGGDEELQGAWHHAIHRAEIPGAADEADEAIRDVKKKKEKEDSTGWFLKTARN